MSSALLQTEYKLYSQNLELFTGLLELQCQACDPSEAEVWLPWQSPSWLQYEENDNPSAKKERKEMK